MQINRGFIRRHVDLIRRDRRPEESSPSRDLAVEDIHPNVPASALPVLSPVRVPAEGVEQEADLASGPFHGGEAAPSPPEAEDSGAAASESSPIRVHPKRSRRPPKYLAEYQR